MIGPIDRKNMYQKSNTLCWECANACGGCSWSESLEPVKGWEAEPVTIKSYAVDSFLVKWCPEFEPEMRGTPGRLNHIRDDACLDLLEAAMDVAHQDYIKTNRKGIRDEIVCFLADWTEDWEQILRQLHIDRHRYWGNKLLDVIWKRIKHQPLRLYAGSSAATEGTP